MDSFFNIKLEFDQDRVDDVIRAAIKNGEPGYVCVVNANIISTAERNFAYREAVNGALVNICDGSLVALVSSLVRLKRLKPFTGSDLFAKYVSAVQDYRHFFLGSDPATLIGLRQTLIHLNHHLHESSFCPLPFMKDPKDFDFPGIAALLNETQPDFVWVSLGAPKQEQFMHYLKPYLNKGIMCGVGAVFAFYSGNPRLTRAPKVYRTLNLEWLYRVLKEPGRLKGRFWQELIVMSRLSVLELMRVRRGQNERK